MPQPGQAVCLPFVPAHRLWLDEDAPFPGNGGVLSTNIPIGPASRKFVRR